MIPWLVDHGRDVRGCQMSELRHVLTVKEASALARVSPATIRRWCRIGYLNAFQASRGATIRIPRQELQKLTGDGYPRPSG